MSPNPSPRRPLVLAALPLLTLAACAAAPGAAERVFPKCSETVLSTLPDPDMVLVTELPPQWPGTLPTPSCVWTETIGDVRAYDAVFVGGTTEDFAEFGELLEADGWRLTPIPEAPIGDAFATFTGPEGSGFVSQDDAIPGTGLGDVVYIHFEVQ